VVRRQDRDHGPVLRRPHPGRARLRQSAGRGGDVPRQRRLRQRLSGRHPSRRGLRTQAGDVGLFGGFGEPGGGERPDPPEGDEGDRHPRLVRAHAVEEGPVAAVPRPRVRGLHLRAVAPRRIRRLLEADGDLRRGLLRPVQRRADGPHVVVVRSLSAHGDAELHRPLPRKTLARAADPGTVDPRGPHLDLRGRRRTV
jgi:hypothetical protein